MSDEQTGGADAAEREAGPSEPLFFPRDQPPPPAWFVESVDPPLPDYVPGSFPVWRLLLAGAIALFALWNVAAFFAGPALTSGGPSGTIDFIWLAGLVIACAAGIFVLMRRR